VIGQSNNEVIIGQIKTLKSDILKEERTLWIHVPNGYDGTKEYPVIYLLDGATHFTSVVGLVEHYSQANGNSITPKMIVVGILNTNRTRDLTPSKAEAQPPMFPESMAKESGGGKKFMAFIEKELIPHIEANYSVAPYRMFIGHSFGGLTVINTFVHHPELFNSYVVIDPSMSYNNNELLSAMETQNFNEAKFRNKSLYLGIANNMPNGMDTIAVKEDNNPMNEPLRAVMKTNNLLKSVSKGNFKYQGKFYLDDNHTSVPLITEYDALRFIFNSYAFDIMPEDVLAPNSDIVGRMQEHYRNASEEYGFNIRPDESTINYIGYMLMEMNKMEMAGEFFKMNVENYPKSANAYDSMGDYYIATGDKNQAISSYQKAIALNDYEPSKEKLKELVE
jgi:predicted alpha/beta superfamily hydrolase